MANKAQSPGWAQLALLWLAGLSLRITVLAVPPVMPLIHQDMHLTEREVGTLSGLPILMLSLGAVSGSLLLARLGINRALGVGLALTAIGGALRGVGTTPLILFFMTFLMGLGIAIMQPALPTLTRRWFPSRVGFATSVYVNGLLTGEIASSSLTIHVVLPLVGNSWQWSFVVWSIPVVLSGLAFLIARRTGLIPPGRQQAAAQKLRWWPDWSNWNMWRIGLMLGCLSSMYWTLIAFLPDYLHRIHGRPDLLAPALASLNAIQVPASFALMAVSDRLIGRRSPFILMGGVVVIATIGALTMPGWWLVFWVGVIGAVSSSLYILTLGIAAAFDTEGDVHRFSAGGFVICYFMASVTPVISGTLWDLTHISELAFLPVGLAGVLLGLLAPKMPVRAEQIRNPSALAGEGC